MDSKRIELRLKGLDCENEAAKIEGGLAGRPGLLEIKTYPKAGKVALVFDPNVSSAKELEGALSSLGFPVIHDPAEAEVLPVWRNPKVLTSVASGVLLLLGWMGSLLALSSGLSLVLYLVAIGLGGYYFAREGAEKLIERRTIGIELLMSTAAIGAALLGETLEAAMLVFLYSISEAAEGYTEQKTRAAVRALMKLAPKIALLRRGGVEQEVSVEELAVRDIFIVRPGESVATDGEVISGTSSVNQAPVTGESAPVIKNPGDIVFAGTVNADGVLEVRATKTFSDNTLAKIIHLVEEAQEKKGESQRFIERFGSAYSPIVLVLGVLLAVLPPLLAGALWASWASRAIVFIVAAAPCALVISVPITLVASLGTGARNGVLIKGGVVLERLAAIKVVALDKTGTLTRGEPVITDIVPLIEGRTELELIAAAAGIEAHSEHPVARAVVRYAKEKKIPPALSSAARAIPGAGIVATIEERELYAGKPALFREKLQLVLGEKAEEAIRRLESEGKTVIMLGEPTQVWAILAARDTLRDDAPKAIQRLKAQGVECIILSGDQERAVSEIAREVGISQFYGSLTPEEKLLKVRTLTKQTGHVAMVGDGVNDAPALAEASVGIAMGAAGTDVALETADVVLMADDLNKLSFAISLAQKTQSVVRQNLLLSCVVIVTLAAGAILGSFTLPIAVLVHEISEFVVIASGLRMLRAPQELA